MLEPESKTLAVIGLGKLGAPMAAVFAAKRFNVVGVDVNPNFVAAVNDGRAPVEEPGLQAMFDQGRARLKATLSFEEAIIASDASFIIVPTPSEPDFFFTNKYVVDAVAEIGAVLRKTDRYHVVVVTSTVMPGSTGGPIREALEAASRRKVGETVGLCYSPEFIALGSVVRDMLRPDLTLIGESDARAGSFIADIYQSVVETRPAVHRMSFANAELCKLAINTYVTTKISYANMIAELCDRLPGTDADVICQAIGADSRIGVKYLRGAIGYGGPCFPRDNKAFAALGRRLGVSCDLAEATDRVNERQVWRMVGLVDAYARPGAVAAVLGMSYKPDTHVIEASQGVMLARALAERGFRVVVADPQAAGSAVAVLGQFAERADSADEALAKADVAVVMTPWPDFRSLRPSSIRRPAGRLVIIDPWNIIDPANLGDGVELVLPGRMERQPAAAIQRAGMAGT